MAFGLVSGAFMLLPAESFAQTTIVGQRIACTEGMADAFPCEGVDLLSVMKPEDIGAREGNTIHVLNDIWGWSDPDSPLEVALVGRTDGTSFVDVTDPFNPVYLGNLPRRAGTNPTTWRDIKVYDNHAYIGADSAPNSGVQIFDLTQLRSFAGTPQVYEPTAVYDGVSRLHNLYVNEATATLFIVGADGANVCGRGLHMVDISEPASPGLAGCFSHVGTGRQLDGYTHDTQCIIYNGPDDDHNGREICFSSNETHVSIADVTDKGAPQAISSATYPNVAYVHQGWLSADQRYFFQGDELDENNRLVTFRRTLVWDVQDLDDPILAAEYSAPGTSIDHNMYVVGDRLYQSNYVDGLQVLDISNPELPVEIGSFDTHPAGGTWSGSWSNYPFFRSGAIAVSSSHFGLFMVVESDRSLAVTGTEKAAELPAGLTLSTAFPNPFSSTASIEFSSSSTRRVNVSLLDMTGREVQSVFDGVLPTGSTSFSINGDGLAAGVFVLRISGDDFSVTRSLTHLP